VTEKPYDETLVDDLAQRIRARIMNGEIPIGAPLRQAALAAELGVSRTPIREALRQLQSGGLITMAANRGAVVRVPTPWEVRYAYEVRAELEGLAAARASSRITRGQLDELRRLNDVLRSAVEHADGEAPRGDTAGANDSFHTIISAAAANPWLAMMVERVNASFPRRVSTHAVGDDERYRLENVTQHDRVVDALAAEDETTARDLMRAHIISAGEHLAAWYEQRSATVFQG
jgi:DNA-binding GntR family transcriptional regulator